MTAITNGARVTFLGDPGTVESDPDSYGWVYVRFDKNVHGAALFLHVNDLEVIA